MNIRVAGIQTVYRERKARGAKFLTELKDRGAESRCYMGDTNGHLIEVGQSTGIPDQQYRSRLTVSAGMSPTASAVLNSTKANSLLCGNVTATAE